MKGRRKFLFLQGPCTPFFARLAKRLETDGHQIFRVNFCAGDAAYWGGRSAWHFRGDVASLRAYLDEKYSRFGITDQVLFGDRRPVHRPAVEHGETCEVRTHVFEEGYFRPYWITLEREGVNGHSLLPRDPDWFQEAGASLAPPGEPVPFRFPFSLRAAHDVAYHAAGAFNPFLYPRYRTHAGVTAPVEYLGYIRRFSMLKLIRQRECDRVRELVASCVPYFVLPLQLNTDAQIRDHSRFEHMGEVMEYVLESFARHAPPSARLVIKNHPLDMGLMNYKRVLADCERRFDLAGRIVYLEDGDLVALVRNALGVVTVNSTVGLFSLEQGTPTATLSDPIYNLPGLTFQGVLDDFWTCPIPPDPELFSRFQRVVMYAAQVNGGFYCQRGISLAVENSSRILTAEQSPLEFLLARVPPEKLSPLPATEQPLPVSPDVPVETVS